ncbi:helix-turn-helix domain-containing protein [Halopiger xanaduensis]|uniref:Bacterio-opsin activator HTH domain protein n=1 Tax=Halopiger xanaduensis (strain DSM 18323 / JCM 14033 / SH-6) TaxID=797210 RepID=F8D6K2_HALXS|nr:helix-turn-helix domain-containing protein [Halopiger xanaduensis]AEH36598.1 Bacterio-opsin activator HTH domain protein [Halopiger xanaduensis SH-6]
MTGFRATVVVHDPQDCPVATVSSDVGEAIDSVTRTRGTGATGETVVEEFGVPAGDAVEVGAAESGTDVDLEPVQSNDREAVYRFERESTNDCACEIVEGTGTPLSSVRAQDGSLLLSFRTFELEEVAAIVDELRERFDGVLVEDLAQDHEDGSTDPVIVDREVLTARQREILETAHEMGYFEYPKGANATDVAAELGVARSTFSEHLAAAQTKLMNEILDK